jgi:hypothetical protein
MNDSTLTSATVTKARQPAQQWVRFYDLNHEETFYIGRHTVKKSGLFTFRWLTGPEVGQKSIAPWARVRSQRPVKKVKSETPAKS